MHVMIGFDCPQLSSEFCTKKIKIQFKIEMNPFGLAWNRCLIQKQLDKIDYRNTFAAKVITKWMCVCAHTKKNNVCNVNDGKKAIRTDMCRIQYWNVKMCGANFIRSNNSANARRNLFIVHRSSSAVPSRRLQQRKCTLQYAHIDRFVCVWNIDAWMWTWFCIFFVWGALALSAGQILFSLSSLIAMYEADWKSNMKKKMAQSQCNDR